MQTVRLTRLKVRLLTADKPAYAIAADCGIHPSQLSLYAQGKEDMAVKHLRALAKYFKCSQHDLLGTTSYEFAPEDQED